MTDERVVALSVSDLGDLDIDNLFGDLYWYLGPEVVRRQLESAILYGCYRQSLVGIIGVVDADSELKLCSWTPALAAGVCDDDEIAVRLLASAQGYATAAGKRLVSHNTDSAGSFAERQLRWLKAAGFSCVTRRLLMTATCRLLADGHHDICIEWKQVAKPQLLAPLVARCYQVSLDQLAKQMTTEQWQRSLFAMAQGAKGVYLPEVSEVAECEQVDVAYYISTAVDGGVYLAALGVAPAWRCHGLGAAVMGRFMERAVKQGFSKASLLVDRDNTPAVRLYEKFGFRQESVEVSGHWEPVMS